MYPLTKTLALVVEKYMRLFFITFMAAVLLMGCTSPANLKPGLSEATIIQSIGQPRATYGHFYKSGVSTAPRLSNFIFSFFKLCDDFLGCSTAFSAANGLFSRDSCLVLCRRRHRRRTNPIKAKYLFANQHLNSAQVVRQVHQTDSHLGSRTSYRA